MKTIRVCIGSNDGENIANSHLGDTDIFFIYDIFKGNQAKFIDKRVNSAKDMEHDKADKMKAIINLVKDASVFTARQKSPNFVNIAKKTKYQPVVIKADKIDEILIILQQSFDEIASYVLRRENGEKFENIPEFK